MRTIALLFLVGMGVLGLMNAPLAYAQQPTPDPINQMERIAEGLYCPVCAGVPLNVCETQACEQWRNLILDKIRNGETDAQIRQYFIDQYGDRVLGAPPPEGFNLGAYLLPLFILVGGAAILFFSLRGWLRPSTGFVGGVVDPEEGRARAASGTPAADPPIAPEYAERIARELKERE